MFGALTRQHRGRELFPLYVEVILYGVIFTGTAKAYSVCQFNLCPAWGRLREALEDPAYQAFQSTPPHGGRLIASLSRNATYEFQSTPPAWGATRPAGSMRRSSPNFNPRPPHGGRPHGYHQRGRCGGISIHAPRMGGDWLAAMPAACSRYFNPRPPHGGRLSQALNGQDRLIFQSTPPAWGATGSVSVTQQHILISIHAPRMGGDAGVLL